MNKYTLLLVIPCVVFVMTQAMGYYPGAAQAGYGGQYPYTGYYQQYAVQSQQGAQLSNFANMILFFTVFALATNFTGSLTG